MQLASGDRQQQQVSFVGGCCRLREKHSAEWDKQQWLWAVADKQQQQQHTCSRKQCWATLHVYPLRAKQPAIVEPMSSEPISSVQWDCPSI